MLTQTDRLKDRIEMKRKQLEARMAELKKDSRDAAAAEREKLESKLSELKMMLAQGWDNVSESTAAKLNTWLDKLN